MLRIWDCRAASTSIRSPRWVRVPALSAAIWPVMCFAWTGSAWLERERVAVGSGGILAAAAPGEQRAAGDVQLGPARASCELAARVSRIASPAAGPSAYATATARFASMTGDGSNRSSVAVQRGDLPPVGGGGCRRGPRGRRRWRPAAGRGRDVRWASAAPTSGPPWPRCGARSHRLRSWSGSRIAARRPGQPGRWRCEALVEQDEGKQPGDLGLIRREPVQPAGELQRSSHRSSLDDGAGAVRRVSLSEGEDRAEHRRQRGQPAFARIRHAQPDARVADLPLRPHDPAERRLGSGSSSSRAIDAANEPAHDAQGECHQRCRVQRRVAARKQQRQLVVSGDGAAVRLGSGPLLRGLALLPGAGALAAAGGPARGAARPRRPSHRDWPEGPHAATAPQLPRTPPARSPPPATSHPRAGPPTPPRATTRHAGARSVSPLSAAPSPSAAGPRPTRTWPTGSPPHTAARCPDPRNRGCSSRRAAP